MPASGCCLPWVGSPWSCMDKISMRDIGDSNNRKLIRPSLSKLREQSAAPKGHANGQNGAPPRERQGTPPGQTNAENFYYVKQMQNRTAMVLVLTDGEILKGVIEWYDKACLKLNREDGANLVIYKDSIKYLYKAAEKGTQSETSVNGAAAGESMTA